MGRVADLPPPKKMSQTAQNMGPKIQELGFFVIILTTFQFEFCTVMIEKFQIDSFWADWQTPFFQNGL